MLSRAFKRAAFSCLTLLLSGKGFAAPSPAFPSAVTYSTRSLVASLAVAQGQFDNWRPGGEDSLNWTSRLDGSRTRRWDEASWENNLRLAYGQSQQGAAEPVKSADTIHADSTYVRDLRLVFNPYAGVSADTQFMNGYQYFYGTTITPVVVSKFMDPAYFTESFGLAYAYGDSFRFRIGGAAKQTVTDVYTQYADNPETPTVERFKNELGLGSVTDLKLTLAQNLKFSSRLDLFSNLAALDQVDVLWANSLVGQVSPWLAAHLDLDLAYDRDVSTQRQLRQSLNVSLSYALF
jgi:hypothetical protein